MDEDEQNGEVESIHTGHYVLRALVSFTKPRTKDKKESSYYHATPPFKKICTVAFFLRLRLGAAKIHIHSVTVLCDQPR